ncbi:hypothetical protein Tco_0340686 [Tanacetum coccineum]
MGSHTLQQLRGYSFDEIKVLFEATMKRVNTFTLMESDDTVPKVVARSSKRSTEEELGEENMLKNFNRDDLVKLWDLVRRKFQFNRPLVMIKKELYGVGLKSIMDPNTSIRRLCLEEDNRISLNDGVESNEEWDTPKYHDTIDSGKKKEAKAFAFYQMETEDISERYDAACFVNGLGAYDREINLEHDKNLISNAVKLCLEHEVKNGDKIVKKELIVALRGEIYFVTFIINPEEDDIKPRVVLGRSFLSVKLNALEMKDDWDVILEGIDFGEIPKLMGPSCGDTIKEMLEIKVNEMGELCEEFYSTYEFNEVVPNDELMKKKVIKFRLCGQVHSLSILDFARRLGLYTSAEIQDDGYVTYFLGALRNYYHFNANQYWLSISSEEELLLSRSLAKTIRKPVLRNLYANVAWLLAKWMKRKGVGTHRERETLDVLTLRELTGPNGKLIPKDPAPGIPRVATPKGQRPTITDLYDKIGQLETRHRKLERRVRRQPYQLDRYAGVFEYTAG